MPLEVNRQAVMGLNDYRRFMSRAVAGLLADSNVIDEISGMNSGQPVQQTIAPLTIAGTIAAGNIATINLTITTPIGTSRALVITYAAVAGNTAADVAIGLQRAIDANDIASDFINPTVAAGVLTLNVRPNRKIDAVSASAQGAMTITAAPVITNPTVAPQVRWGYFVASYPGYIGNQAGAITTNTNAVILGINKLYKVFDNNSTPWVGSALVGTPNEGQMLIVRQGRIWVPVSGAVARGQQAAYLNTTGQPCATGTAGSTDVPGATFFRASGTDGLAVLELNLP